jgi:diguanylate cyclase (GGDEF)-like protein/PAS domain S-box-containing protein
VQADWPAFENRDVDGYESSRLTPTLSRHIASLIPVFDATPVAMGVWSMGGSLVHANPVFRDLVHLTAEEVPGQRFESFIDPFEAAGIRELVEGLWAGRRNYFECDFRCAQAGGGEHWVRSMVTAVYGPDAQPDYILSQVFDFSNPRTRASQAQRLVNETPVMLWLTGRAAMPRIGNRTTFDYLGIGPDDPDLRGALLRTVHPEDLAEITPAIVASVEDRAPFEFTARVARRDGVYRWLHNRALPFFDADGEYEGYAGASLDVTESEELRRELHDVRELFRTVTEAGPIAVLRTDVDGDIVRASGGWPDVLDLVPDELVGLNWQSVLAVEHVEEIMARGIESVSTRDPFTIRVRTLDRDAQAGRDDRGGRSTGESWAELRVAPVFSEDGEHDGFVATLADVSSEVAAGTRADRLARVLDAGSDFLLIAEGDGAISYVNDAAHQTLGVTASTGNGTQSFLMDVLEPDSHHLYRETVQPTLLRDGIWRGELFFRTRVGAPVPVSTLILAHENDLGQIESISAVARDITDQKDAERQLRQLATHDHLTGLPNRVLLYDRLEQALARFHRHDQHVALFYLDLDRFKPINDEMGHQVGDAVLVEISDRIHTVIRDTDTAARIGGDEFAVLVEGIGDPGLLRLVADRLIQTISQSMSVGSRELQVGVSIGVVLAGARSDAVDSLMAAADAAMYRAKTAGRGRYDFVDPDGTPSA